MKHYVYRITNIKLNRYYYGTRTSRDRTPQEDIGTYYFSSSHDTSFIQDQKDNPQDYTYKIVYIFSTREQALSMEIKLHNKFNVGINENFYNRSKQTSTGWDTTGTKQNRTEEHQNKLNNIYNNLTEEQKLSRNKKISIAMTGNKPSKKTIEKMNKGRAIAKENNPNQGCKQVNIFDSSKILVYTSNGSFRSFCLENKLPYTAFRKALEQKLMVYENASNRPSVVSALKNKGLYEKWLGFTLEYV